MNTNSNPDQEYMEFIERYVTGIERKRRSITGTQYYIWYTNPIDNEPDHCVTGWSLRDTLANAMAELEGGF